MTGYRHYCTAKAAVPVCCSSHDTPPCPAPSRPTPPCPSLPAADPASAVPAVCLFSYPVARPAQLLVLPRPTRPLHHTSLVPPRPVRRLSHPASTRPAPAAYPAQSIPYPSAGRLRSGGAASAPSLNLTAFLGPTESLPTVLARH